MYPKNIKSLLLEVDPIFQHEMPLSMAGKEVPIYRKSVLDSKLNIYIYTNKVWFEILALVKMIFN